MLKSGLAREEVHDLPRRPWEGDVPEAEVLKELHSEVVLQEYLEVAVIYCASETEKKGGQQPCARIQQGCR